jgi:hypothetical protein
LGFLGSLKKNKTEEKKVPVKGIGLPPPPPFKPSHVTANNPVQPLTPPQNILDSPPKLDGLPPKPLMEVNKIQPLNPIESKKEEIKSPPPINIHPVGQTQSNVPKMPNIPPVPKFDLHEPIQKTEHTLKPTPIKHIETKPIITHTIERKELPSFPMKGPKKSTAPDELPEIPDMEIPEPPPNLRSELSPLELEKLEKEYLGKRIVIEDVEQPFEYKRHKGVKKPLYVRTDDYRKMLENFIDIKQQLTESDETLFRIENIKKNKDNEFNDYKRSIEDIQRKLIFIDKTIFKN